MEMLLQRRHIHRLALYRPRLPLNTVHRVQDAHRAAHMDE